MVVEVMVCGTEKVKVPFVMTDALGDVVLEAVALLCVAESTGLEDDIPLVGVLEMTVLTVEDGVAYGGRFKFGVTVGQSVHALTSFAPRTWPAYTGGMVIPPLM
jgi:hypothetical protein